MCARYKHYNMCARYKHYHYTCHYTRTRGSSGGS